MGSQEQKEDDMTFGVDGKHDDDNHNSIVCQSDNNDINSDDNDDDNDDDIWQSDDVSGDAEYRIRMNEILRVKENMEKMGIKEGASQSKEDAVQKGFEEGLNSSLPIHFIQSISTGVEQLLSLTGEKSLIVDCDVSFCK